MIDLFYPASFLPHKNHLFLDSPIVSDFLILSDIKVYLTISNSDYSFSSPNIISIGRISRESCLHHLHKSFALLFLSSFESLGLPIIEACQLSKPVICPDLIYSRELLGDSAYYFDLQSPQSLCNALTRLMVSNDQPIEAELQTTLHSINYAWDQFTTALNHAR